jgi:hypothetical protein
MSGRRRDSRYRLSVPFDGSLLVFQDVSIEGYEDGDQQLTVVTHAPVPVGEELTLDVPTAERRATRRVHVVESTAVVVKGELRYRLRLAVQR